MCYVLNRSGWQRLPISGGNPSKCWKTKSTEVRMQDRYDMTASANPYGGRGARRWFELRSGLGAALRVLGAWVIAVQLAGVAHAEYPERIIRIVVPFAAGGGTDVVARTLGQEMARELGGSVVIENKPGGGTVIGSQFVALSDPDGYTLLLATFAHAVNPSLMARLPFDP